jgi:adenosylcobinamide-GDP ribazoletransferase
LHLDGAIDTADGLATPDSERRLAVMADSRVGAFGAIAAVIILLLKTFFLSDLSESRWLTLIFSAAWGRWAQVVAVACYPYLKATGKGRFHKDTIQPLPDIWLGLLPLVSLSALQITLFWERWWSCVIISIVGSATIALLTPWWFDQRFGGHTGDTYGATVEWTEVFVLLLTLLVR